MQFFFWFLFFWFQPIGRLEEKVEKRVGDQRVGATQCGAALATTDTIYRVLAVG